MLGYHVFTVIRARDVRDGLVVKQVWAGEMECLATSAALVSLMAFPWVAYMYVGGKEWSGLCRGDERTGCLPLPRKPSLLAVNALWPLRITPVVLQDMELCAQGVACIKFRQPLVVTIVELSLIADP